MTEIIVDLAQQLGVAADRIWPDMVWAYWLGALWDRLVWSGILAGLGIALWRLRVQVQQVEERDQDPMGWQIAMVILGVATGIIGLAYLGTWPHAIQALTSPEATLILDALPRR